MSVHICSAKARRAVEPLHRRASSATADGGASLTATVLGALATFTKRERRAHRPQPLDFMSAFRCTTVAGGHEGKGVFPMSYENPTRTRLSMRDYLWAEADAMAIHAVSAGRKVPSSVLEVLDASKGERETMDVRRLATAHESLAKLVAPATPRLLLALTDDAVGDRRRRAFGRLPLVRTMLFLATLSLLTFMGLSASSWTANIEHKLIWDQTGGYFKNTVIEVFYLSAAALGASFSALSQADRAITAGTFDPEDQSAYWTRFFLGLMAGFLLASFFNFEGSTDASSRFPLTEPQLENFSSGPVVVAVTHPDYRHETVLSDETRRELLTDLDR